MVFGSAIKELFIARDRPTHGNGWRQYVENSDKGHCVGIKKEVSAPPDRSHDQRWNVGHSTGGNEWVPEVGTGYYDIAAANGHGNQYVDQRYVKNYNETGADRWNGVPRYNHNHASSAYNSFRGNDTRGAQQAFTTPFNPAAPEFQPRSLAVPVPNYSNEDFGNSAVDYSGRPVMGDGSVWYTDPAALMPAMLPHPEMLPVPDHATPMFYPSQSQNGEVFDLPLSGYDMSGSHGRNNSTSNISSNSYRSDKGSAAAVSNSNSNTGSKKSSTLDVGAAVFNPSRPIKT